MEYLVIRIGKIVIYFEMHEFKMNKFFCCYPHAMNKKKNCLLQYFSLFCVIIVSFTLENIISISGFISEMRII